MSVMITRKPFRSAKLLEYLSLIRYAAKYHRGLGWCVYDNKFCHKAAAKKMQMQQTRLWGGGGGGSPRVQVPQ